MYFSIVLIRKGYYIATLLSCLNTDEALMAGARDFLPDKHYLAGGKTDSTSVQSMA
jgi:hypothetical protein